MSEPRNQVCTIRRRSEGRVMERFCRECASTVSKHNTTGLCRPCSMARVKQRTEQRIASILQDHAEGLGFEAIARKHNLTAQTVYEYVVKNTPPPVRLATMANIIAVAAENSGFTVEEIKSKSRTRPLARVRHAVCYAGKQCNHSYAQVGNHIGRRDHSTTMHAYRACEVIMEREPEYAAFVADLIAQAKTRVTAEPLRIVKPVVKAEPAKQPEPEADDSLDELDALSAAIAAHYARERRVAA